VIPERDHWMGRGAIAEASMTENRPVSNMVYIEVFIYLQLLDFLTTLIGMRLGLGEASPFIRWLMHVGPATGLAFSKLVAFILGGACIWLERQYLLRWINYWYAGLVVWNMSLILRVLR
jgi:hypothetical protein